MTITERLIKDSNIKYVLRAVREYSPAMTEFTFNSTLQADNFLDWLRMNIEYYDGDVTQYYKNDGLTVTVEFKQYGWGSNHEI